MQSLGRITRLRVTILLLLSVSSLAAAQTTTVTFDNPAPSGASDSYINGIFQGINFGTNQWRWSGPFGSDPTNNVYFANSTGTSRTFTFSPAPRVLTSMSFYTTVNGTLTLSDGLNTNVVRTVNTGSLQVVTTGWTQASTTVTVGFTAGWALGVDDIVYSAAGNPSDTTPPTVSVTAPSAGATLSGNASVTATAGDNVGVVGVQFLVDGVALGAEDTVAPYAITWDTTAAANGPHVISARARDAGTNQTTSTGVSISVSNSVGSGFGYALRFNGNAVNDIDRVKIRIDDPANSLPGPPMDLGATDFTLEFWVNGSTAQNGTGQISGGANNGWINGNIVVDRDRYNQDRNFGISFTGGRLAFGVAGQGTGFQTLVGTSNVLDGQWHHVAVQRRRNDGWMWVYIDGTLQSQVDGPNGDISYPDDGVPGNFCGGPCTNSNPFIVLGAEKHDAGAAFPAYNGLFDELRASSVLRYSSNFTRPNRPFAPDPTTLGLYHFDEGTGDYIYDSSGAYGGPSLGVRRLGGSPQGPLWQTQTPFTAAPASEVGEWNSLFSWPIIQVHASLLNTGQVLLWDGNASANYGGTSARLWNPATGVFTQVPNNSTDIFCGAHSFLPDGRLLVAGGNQTLYWGLRDTNIFNPANSTWTRVANMTYLRWYPTTVTLGDGRVLVTSGSTTCNTCIPPNSEVYNPSTNTWTELTGAPLAMTATYPYLFVLPDGRVLMPASDEEPMATRALNVTTQTWSTIDPNITQGGAAVMYSPGRVMKTGSASDVDIATTPTIATTMVLDMNAATPAWRTTEPMAFPRGHHDLTILPDGSVFVNGGGRTTDGVNIAQAVFQGEIWDPVTESWTTMASASRPRLYHQTALLLPDGRVLTGGSGRYDGFPSLDQLNAEIFSPPYLFRGERPIIGSIPAGVQYGTTFFVGNANPASIARVTLVAPGAITHQINMAQRFMELAFTQTAGGLTVQMPANVNLAPPGYYMVFLIGTNGVPSIGSFVQVTSSGASSPMPTTTSITPTSANAGGAQFTLTVNGTGFVPGSIVRWNGNSRTTSYSSATVLTATITAADIASAGSASVTVFTPAPGGGTSNAQTFTINAPANPAPTTTSISPTSVAQGGAAFALIVNGTGFVQGQSVVRINGVNRTTGFTSATQISALITVADIASAGTPQITVFNPTPGGGTSNAQTLTVTASNPVPATTSLSPNSATAAGAAFTLTVNGSNFINGSIVRWGGADRTTGFTSANQLTAQISAADIASAGSVSVTVFTPAPGGGTSNAQTFTINGPTNPAPTTSSISPSSVAAGGGAFALIVNGTGFVQGQSVVQINGVNRTTGFTSPTQVSAFITMADIATAGTAQITVFNPTPGGGTSNAQTLTIVAQNPAPTTSSISPSSVAAGGGAFALIVNGTGFVQGQSVVQINGVNRTTGFTSSTQVSAFITMADIAAAGTAQITVFNPTPGGGTSNAQTLTIAAQNPVPTTSSISPTSVVAGGGAFALTVNGTGFVQGQSVVRINGVNRTTGFTSSAQVSAFITMADIATAGTAQITVFNPTPGGGTSNAQTLTITTGGGNPTGLVAAYGLNATTGNAVTDSSGNNNNGTVANGTWTTSGRFGSALVFNGTNTLASIPDSPSLDLTTGMTLEAWVYPTVQPTGWRAVVLKETTNNVLYYLEAGSDSSNRPATGVFAGGAERVLYGGTRLTANTWTHLAATYDGVTQRLFVNGTQVSSRAQTGAIATSNSPLRLGGVSLWGEYFQGRIDEVRVYNRALIQSEIQTDMNSAVP